MSNVAARQRLPSAGTWAEKAKLLPSDATRGSTHGLGILVSLSGGTALAGASGDSVYGLWSGSAYVYTVAFDPVFQIEALVETVERLELKVGIEVGLVAKLDVAHRALQDRNEANDVAAANALRAFVNAVKGQVASPIDRGDGLLLIEAAGEILAFLAE